MLSVSFDHSSRLYRHSPIIFTAHRHTRTGLQVRNMQEVLCQKVCTNFTLLIHRSSRLTCRYQ